MKFLLQLSEQLDASVHLVRLAGELSASAVARIEYQPAGISLQGAKTGPVGVSPDVYVVRVTNPVLHIGVEASTVGAPFDLGNLKDRTCGRRSEIEVEIDDIFSLKRQAVGDVAARH
jgi:hypothetical protein